MNDAAIKPACTIDPLAGSMSVADLRAMLNLTLEGMGAQLCISKSQMHEVERTGRASLKVALRIEELSDGRIDAADLNEDVRAARRTVPASPPGA